MSRTRRIATISAAAAAALALIVAACGPNIQPTPSGPVSPAPSTATGSPGPDASTTPGVFLPSGSPLPFDGIYVPDEILAVGDDQALGLFGTLPCGDLADIVAAGQWTVTSREEVRDPAKGAAAPPAMILLALRRGNDSALAWLAGGAACSARVVRTARLSLRASGAVDAAGEASADTPACFAGGGDVTVGDIYRGPGPLAFSVTFTAAVRAGRAELDPAGVTVGLERRSLTLPAILGLVARGLRDGSAGAFSETFEAGPDATAALDVTTTDPFTGTLRLAGFEGPAGRLDLEVGVRCDLPNGALRRAAVDASATPAPTPLPTPLPSVGPLPTAPLGTVVATGGAVAGRYAIREGDLTCLRNEDDGTWSVTTSGAGSGGVSVFLVLKAPAGGGHAEHVSLGLIVGNGTGGKIATIDTIADPPLGAGSGDITVAGGSVTARVAGVSAEGATVTAALVCRP